jgi:hypothetical protein
MTAVERHHWGISKGSNNSIVLIDLTVLDRGVGLYLRKVSYAKMLIFSSCLGFPNDGQDSQFPRLFFHFPYHFTDLSLSVSRLRYRSWADAVIVRSLIQRLS